MSKDNQVSPWMHEFSSYVAGALKRKLPAEVAEQAKIHVVDTFAAMISGSRLIPGKRAIAYVKTFRGMQEAGVVGTRIVTSAQHAALTNGIFGHADETDDVHTPTRSHPGTSIVPATLAMAERQQASGESLLRAVVLGYDVCTRLLYALKQELIAKSGFHPSSKGVLFGSAAAAGALLKLDARKIRHVFSYCAEQAAGLLVRTRESQHVEKAYVSGGMPAHNGIAAAQMVASGFTGVEDVFSGESNFLSVFSPNVDHGALLKGLGQEYEIVRTSIKYWPVGGPVQGPLQVLRELILQHGLQAKDVKKLVVHVPDKELVSINDRDIPDITVQHLLAVMLVDGTLTFSSAHDFARMKDPQVLKLRRNHIEAVGDPDLKDPLRRWRCSMEITLKDGRKLSHSATAAKGSLGNPLTRQEVTEKALDLIAPVLGRKRSLALIAGLLNIESVKDARSLRTMYAA